MILADEMGLGKTIQTVAFLNHLFVHERVSGPFLVVVPLSTAEAWKRAFETWSRYSGVCVHGAHMARAGWCEQSGRSLRVSSMNTVLYQDEGGAASRQQVRDYEWPFEAPALRKAGLLRFNALIVTPQSLMADWEHLSAIHWRFAVVDEAHMLKNSESKLACQMSVRCARPLLLSVVRDGGA